MNSPDYHYVGPSMEHGKRVRDNWQKILTTVWKASMCGLCDGWTSLIFCIIEVGSIRWLALISQTIYYTMWDSGHVCAGILGFAIFLFLAGKWFQHPLKEIVFLKLNRSSSDFLH